MWKHYNAAINLHWFTAMLPMLLCSLRLYRQSCQGQERKEGTLSVCILSVSRVNCHTRTSHSSRFFLTQHSLSAGSADGFQKAQDWGLGQGEAQPTWTTVHKHGLLDSRKWTSRHWPSPPKTETVLTHPTNAIAQEKYTPHTHCPVLREDYSDKAVGPVRMIPRSPGKAKGGRGWQSSKSLVLAILRWHLNQLCMEVPCLMLGFLW